MLSFGQIVAKLFHHHLGFALDKDVSEMLWGSQSRLYQRMRKELDKQLTSPRNGKRRELYMKIAKLVCETENQTRGHETNDLSLKNCESVLNTLRAEWIQLALLVESSDGRKIVIFPIEEPNSALCALDDADATKRFSSLFHAKVGEIASWKVRGFNERISKLKSVNL